MVLQKTFGLVLGCLLCACTKNCSSVKLVNNGYRDIVIAINPGIEQNDKLIENIQEMVTEASSYLYRATKQQVYFSDVKILLPVTWKVNSTPVERPTPQFYAQEMVTEASSYLYRATKQQVYFSDVKILLPVNWTVNSTQVQRPTNQSYEKADVIIAEPYLKYGDDPYTLQYGGCGEKGRYIHFTPNFILNNSLTPVYGSRGRVFVHEWAHFQWGVFDEYNDLVPFYLSTDGITEATRCSIAVKGKTAVCTGSSCSPCSTDANTGLYNVGCKFFPEKGQSSSSSIMYLQGLSNVVEFCDDKTHNPEAPNMQNKMCNLRSTWDVISKSEDFRNNSLPHNGSLVPTFTLLQAKDRVLCLVLDVSGSMGSENRINRLRQAAEIFLLQIIETRSHVGIVTFSSSATIQTGLKAIDNDDIRNELVQLLPTLAGGGTNICAGIQSSFQVLRGDDSVTNGDEIVLLTDGKDGRISTCFREVEQSGAVIHTIALGPNAAVELEKLSAMTGGLQFAATDNVNTSGLIDAFTGLVSGNGDINQQSIQLENSGMRIEGNDWFNGTVDIDKTVGKDTFFAITWETQTPNVFVRDPSGMMYNNGDFKVDGTALTARLRINGTAQTGTWMYAILNPGIKQAITITVTSRAADEKVPPVTVNGHISRKDSTSPIIVYAEVSHGFLPVLFANVTAITERPTGPPIVLKLSDDGLGADIVRNDGIYSKYFLDFKDYGRYNFKLRVQGKDGATRMAIRKGGRAMYIPGYTENGNIQTNPPRPPVNEEDLQPQFGSFSRVKSGGSISLPPGTPIVDFPPSKITDLQATIVKDKFELEWTAPGEDYDQGTASRYDMRMSDNLLQLRDNFTKAAMVNLTSLNPRPYGSRETVTIVPENTELQNGTTVYFALLAYDKSNASSEMSNVAKVFVFVPLIEHPKDNNVSKIVWIVVVVVIIVCLLAGITAYVVRKKIHN
ncbi:calcium-activated chloride channel regulator 1-like isoform X1 [Heptranchias perlo]|uniref:calcium-activated chloride channel regulator 1-like isoform X1 n=2 Tax=Heptranchias perlo TaxID=212740 RepID=UPI00355A691D